MRLANVGLGADYSADIRTRKVRRLEIRSVADPLDSGTEPINGGQAADMSLTVIRIATRIGISCALIAVGAVGLFIVIRYLAWVG
jgi:hypothetical protein